MLRVSGSSQLGVEVGDQRYAVMRRFRIRAGLTQEALAERSGVSVRTIRGLETGQRRNPQLVSLQRLADAMDLCPAERDELLATALNGTPAVAEPSPTQASGTVPAQLPGSPWSFSGREAELAALDEVLRPGSPARTSVIRGAGGIGKTWLALAWAHRHIDRFPDGQLFVDLHGFSPTSTPKDPTVAIRGFLDALGTSRIPTELDDQAALYRSLLANKQILIVLDNAATTDQVVPLLPGGPGCTVLVTSRAQLAGLVTQHSAHTLRLNTLNENESHTLLTRRLGTARLTTETQAVTDLIESCGGFPLALAVIAGHAHSNPQIPLTEFATELRQSGVEALQDADPAISLPTVLASSYRALTTEQQQAFALLGIAPGPDIGLPAAASLTGLPTTQARTVLRALTDASLLNRQANDRYSMHDIIRHYATTTAHNDVNPQTRELALRRIVDFYTHTAHTADRQLSPHRQALTELRPPTTDTHHPLPDITSAIAWFDVEHPNLLAAQHTAVTHGWHHPVWLLAWNLSTFHTWRATSHEALAMWQAALAAANHLPDPIPARTHRLLGLTHTDLGRHEKAIEHLHQALTLNEQAEDLAQQAQTHRVLARAWARQDDNQRALLHANQALELVRDLDEPVWMADALNDTGWYAARVGDYNTARTHCQAALTLSRRHEQPICEAAALDSLGYIDHHTGHHNQAITHYQQALALFRTQGNTYFAANTLDRLGHSHAALGQHDTAHTAWREALNLYREQGRDHDAEQIQRQLDHPIGVSGDPQSE